MITLLTSLSNKETEQEFYSLLADIRGDITADEVSKLSIPEVLSDVKKIIRENDIKSFFTSALVLK